MEKDELQATRSPDVDRAAAGGPRTETRTADERAILALQRSAGNRAVGALLARPPETGGRAAASGVLPLQRAPDDLPKEDRVWPVAWPEETEGERNEPCFFPDQKAKIQAGADAAAAAGGSLSARPPDLTFAVASMETALMFWRGVDGGSPGRDALAGAISDLQRVLVGVSVHTTDVAEVLTALKDGTILAFNDIADAASSTTQPESSGDEPEPCFEEAQQAVIERAARQAFAAADELAKRPPDYSHALATLQSAANAVKTVKGRAPGQAKLKTAVDTLDVVMTGVRAYLAPVEALIAEASEAATRIADGAIAAADMSYRGPFAEGEEEAASTGSGPSTGAQGAPT